MPRTNGRPRGAPPGNTNALKHGYSSSRFNPSLGRDLLTNDDLTEQVTLLRRYLQHIKILSDAMDKAHDQVSLLRVLNLAMASLHHLLRLHQVLEGSRQHKTRVRLAMLKSIRTVLAQFESQPPPAWPPPSTPEEPSPPTGPGSVPSS